MHCVSLWKCTVRSNFILLYPSQKDIFTDAAKTTANERLNIHEICSPKSHRYSSKTLLYDSWGYFPLAHVSVSKLAALWMTSLEALQGIFSGATLLIQPNHEGLRWEPSQSRCYNQPLLHAADCMTLICCEHCFPFDSFALKMCGWLLACCCCCFYQYCYYLTSSITKIYFKGSGILGK